LLLAIRQISQGRRYLSADIARLFMPNTKSISTSKLMPSESTVLQSARVYPAKRSAAATTRMIWKWNDTPESHQDTGP